MYIIGKEHTIMYSIYMYMYIYKCQSHIHCVKECIVRIFTFTYNVCFPNYNLHVHVYSNCRLISLIN